MCKCGSAAAFIVPTAHYISAHCISAHYISIVHITSKIYLVSSASYIFWLSNALPRDIIIVLYNFFVLFRCTHLWIRSPIIQRQTLPYDRLWIFAHCIKALIFSYVFKNQDWTSSRSDISGFQWYMLVILFYIGQTRGFSILSQIQLE